MNVSMKKVAVLSLLLLGLCAGCSTFSKLHRWERKAGGIEPGTPRSLVLEQLPPASTMLDRRVAGTGGPVTYMVDKDIVVKLLFDQDDTLACPIVVEKLHEKRNVSRSTSRPSIHFGAAGSGAMPSGK